MLVDSLGAVEVEDITLDESCGTYVESVWSVRNSVWFKYEKCQ